MKFSTTAILISMLMASGCSLNDINDSIIKNNPASWLNDQINEPSPLEQIKSDAQAQQANANAVADAQAQAQQLAEQQAEYLLQAQQAQQAQQIKAEQIALAQQLAQLAQEQAESQAEQPPTTKPVMSLPVYINPVTLKPITESTPATEQQKPPQTIITIIQEPEPKQETIKEPAKLDPDGKTIFTTQQVSGNWTPNPKSWTDSYSVGNRCYMHTTLDHGIGNVQVETPYGIRSIAMVQQIIGNGPGIGDNPRYNDIQCGNGPANDYGDEDAGECPGRVDRGAGGCGIIGPKWYFD